MKLVNLLENQIKINTKSFRRDTILPEKRIAMVLYYLKDQGSFRMTANTFGVSLSTLSVSLRVVCRAINTILGPEMISFPKTKNEIKEAVAKFEEKFGFPQCIGCIDGTHIPIKKPIENPQNYFCYKMKYSLNVQAVCDEAGLFTNVEIKWPGSVHDARVYSNSQLNKNFISNSFPIFNQELVPGDLPIPPVLIGDPAYPLLPNIMKEYSICIESKQVHFNNVMRTVRNQIECAFGRLKARWRILNRPLDVDLGFAVEMTYTCFILHNFCQLNNNELSNEAVQAQRIIEQRCQSCKHHTQFDHLYSYNSQRGKMVRDSISQFLWDKNTRF